METVPTPAVERDTKRLGEVKRGDWIKLGHLAGASAVTHVLAVFPYHRFGTAYVLLIHRHPDTEKPDFEYLYADNRVGIANADEIPEDPDGSGRDVDNGDAPSPVPAGVDGHGEGAAAGRAVTAQDGGRVTVTRIFTFGHGQTCPFTGKNVLDHHVSITAPTAEQCREVMFATFGQAWAFEYASLDKATRGGQFPSTEHASITIGAES
jgi:hypothetical protein